MNALSRGSSTNLVGRIITNFQFAGSTCGRRKKAA
jgi:hypothetical protein